MLKAFWFLAALAGMLFYLHVGEWVMLGAIVVMILLHELAHWALARCFGYAAPVFTIGFGSAPALTLGTLWGTQFRITPWLLGGYVEVDPHSDEFRRRRGRTRLAVILSGALLNVGMAVAILFALYASIGERVTVSDGISVQRVVDASGSAAAAGLQVGDRLLAVDGKPVLTYEELHAALMRHADGSAAVIDLKRSETRLSTQVVPNEKGQIGVTLHPHLTTTYVNHDVWSAFVRAVTVVGDMVWQLILGVLMILHLVPVTAGAPAGSGDAHGLLSMVQLGGLAFKQGFYSFANEVAFFSVNLAFFNLLPVPGFDGGHLLFFAWEKASGKPVPREWQHKLGRLALIIVVVVMAFALFNDILHPVA